MGSSSAAYPDEEVGDGMERTVEPGDELTDDELAEFERTGVIPE